ncbi:MULTISPECIES: phosphocholine cytidylyltransferase family protein [Providencia]|uniref:phosphocholine cytidylyltransferase family protein n=1 Tax=Providencia rettgeri TaxID=587 RepID=UPI000197C69F|nr:phosphocholine cytidylyltransferase family protein [Providencia rettgeri]EFE51485.1 hypothetical protein PROVRETT_09816 [Providencia rettgeri DSM 1131]QXA57966.1 phosphocholine cytidylyltransferase family protein [Providencia rettgeri]
MKVIILAAGQGTRLRPYTNDRPKCMVELAGKPLLHRQLDTLYSAGVSSNQIALVGGYLKDKLNAPNIKLYTNENFKKTNMVGTLFCAEEFMQSDEDLLICYGDIIYQRDVLTTLLNTDGDITLAADKEWKRLWSLRMDEPLNDAETFKIENGNVVELGKKPQSYDDIDAQYMGLIKVSANKVNDFINFYRNLDTSKYYDGKDFDNMYMTSLIQSLINSEWVVKPALVSNGWLEVDSADELEKYRDMYESGTLADYIKIDS